MKKIWMACASMVLFLAIVSCGKDNTDNYVQNPEEILIGSSWKVVNNTYMYNGSSSSEWDGSLIGQYWKFSEIFNDNSEYRHLYVDGEEYGDYLVTANRVYFTRVIFHVEEGYTFMEDNKQYSIEEISTSKLRLASEWGTSGIQRAVVELERL